MQPDSGELHISGEAVSRHVEHVFEKQRWQTNWSWYISREGLVKICSDQILRIYQRMKKANYSDKQIIVNILSKSFDQNKSINSIIKQDHKRNARIRNLVAYSFEICYLSGEIYLSDDNKGCVLLLQSDKKKTSIKTISLDLKLALTVIGVERIFTILKREAKIKRQHPKIPFYHLWYIGVDPEYQKKGIGSKLLRAVLKKCSREKKPIYLETSTLKNISWYEKFGFSIYDQIDFGYTLYMLRTIN